MNMPPRMPWLIGSIYALAQVSTESRVLLSYRFAGGTVQANWASGMGLTVDGVSGIVSCRYSP